MKRDKLKGKQTPGEASVTDLKTMRQIWVDEQLIAFVHKLCRREENEEADAALYAEAHNVANSTGMWPQDLVDRVKELEACVESLLPLAERIHAACDKGDVLNYDNDCDAADAIAYKAVITNVLSILSKHNP